MYDDINGFFALSDRIIDLTPSECYVLDLLIKHKFVLDSIFYEKYSYSNIHTVVHRLNLKFRGEYVIRRKCGRGFYIKYLGRR